MQWRPQRNALPLYTILLLALVLRLIYLNFQSLWLDELHTMNEASPRISWKELFAYLKCCDQHPPFAFIIERISFTLFGHNAFAARLPSALAGTASVGAMYLLAKEIGGRQLGLMAALICSLNPYNIEYSQEARDYIFAFLFSALSYCYFIRLIKLPSRKMAIQYGLFSALLVYSHYYGLFVLASQVFLAVIFLLQEKGKERTTLFKFFLISASIVTVLYLPWIPYFIEQLKIKSFWITAVPSSFLQDYFFEYFGKVESIKPLLLLLVFFYVAHVLLYAKKEDGPLKRNTLPFSFLLLLSWIFVSLLIPYLRSLLVVSMLYPRYGIIVLPAFILLITYAFQLIRYPLLRYCLLTLFLVLTLADFLFVRKYYSSVSKSQFREMTSYVIKENKENYPIVNNKTWWQQSYYLEKGGSKAALLTEPAAGLFDSIRLKSSVKYRLEGFWLVGAQGEKMPDENTKASLDSAYQVVQQKQFYDAWAQLYVRRDVSKAKWIQVKYDQFIGGAVLADQHLLALYSGSVKTGELTLPKGKYRLVITAQGQMAKNDYPHLILYCNSKKIGSYYLNADLEDKEFSFENDLDGPISITIEMDNDYSEPGKEDRNAFLQLLTIKALN
ncbi:MAG: hypothetical protein JWN76_2104 [Chitinophagaceae bacterium]|nr:hypothetical protein [Chitinophagaceae bacterium]